MAAPEETHDAVIHEEHHDASESRVTRVVVISVDQSAHSHYAFQWALDNFIRPEVSCFHMIGHDWKRPLRDEGRRTRVSCNSHSNPGGKLIWTRADLKFGIVHRQT
jgi:hypothetical protein